MARFLASSARCRLPLLLKTPSYSYLTPLLARAFIAEPRPSAFDENLLRILRSEIAYLADYRPPQPAPATFKSFSVEDRPGEQWIRLRSIYSGRPQEDIKVDATLFDGAAPIPTSSISKKVEALEQGPRLHISLVVEVSRGDDCGSVLEFICSAWPDSLDVQKVFPLRRRGAVLQPYMGRDFKELDKGMQSAVQEYLEERGVDDELAEFLHEYMMNKDKAELLRWLRIVEAYVHK
uniref:Uncharacterized protein At2g39795, mitochondrial n=1 Tax=Elaeis guineensis var. tenera TaxID=51953 RepID=A0A6I9RJU6_ELAGV|nr:uncharacterized protein At2g39795, mitochondrial [Elaeis guineensis]XP_010927520.1 uncharacterized protein At2g39795, mitochondrial [Elaeis guineensis]